MANETWVVNSSPLITLAKIDRLDLLAGQGRDLLIPRPVAWEVLQGPESDPARLAIERGFGSRHPETEVLPELVPWSLGRGESAVLSLAREIGATAVVDDRDARVAASALGVRTIGTLGIVLSARRTGQLSLAAPVILQLRDAGLRLSERLVSQALWEAFEETIEW